MVNLPDRKGVVLVDLNGAPYTISAGGTSMTDNAAFTPGSSSGTPAFFEVDDTGTSAASEGSAGIARMTVQRGVHVNLRDVAGAEITTWPVTNAGLTELAAAINSNRLDINIAADGVGIGGGTQYTEDAAAAADPVGTALIMVRDDALSGQTTTDGDNVAARGTDKGELYVKHADSIAVTGTVDLGATDNAVLDAIAASLAIIDATVFGAGTEAGALRVTLPTDGTGVVKLGAGTAGIGKLTANSGVDIGDVDILSIAAGDNNIGNVDVVTLPALAAGTNAIGKLVPSDKDITGHSAYMKKYYTSAGAATDGIIWSPAAGTRWHITSLYIQISAAATITLEDDLAGGDSAIWKGEFAANSGVFMTFDPLYPWASGEDAADLIITTTAGNVYVTAVGYEI